MMKLSFFKLFFVVLLCSGVIIGEAMAQQNLPFIRVSPQAYVSQNIGFAKIDINYSRPGVKGRNIWGKLVPYGLAPNAFDNGKPLNNKGDTKGAKENYEKAYEMAPAGQKVRIEGINIFLFSFYHKNSDWTINKFYTDFQPSEPVF